ncbi:serpin family protein [Spirillospora sp. NPDC048911]|uniref:serpin family protein n=1 Tax=Spirillospora sp. NPDC048911 TaxID=3364527 RepID=UPI00371222C6
MGSPHLDFTLSLLRELPAGQNFAWSPYSVASALGIASAGARGRTYDELAAAIAPGGDLGDIAAMLAGSTRIDPHDLGGAEMAVANDLWMRDGLGFGGEFQKTVLGWPGGALHTADFAGDPDGARREINLEVERTTRGLIKDLLAEGTIHPDAAAVIVNALYLKVAWLHAFERTITKPAAFHAPSGTRQVPTMRQSEHFGYAEGHGWRMATLHTQGEAAVDVLLPDGDLATAEAALNADVLGSLYGGSGRAKLDLALPRFRIEGEAVLNGALQALGVNEAFTPRADFSGISEETRIWIDQVVHKAVLTVDEEGFEGAAATAIVMRTVSIDLGTPVPFLVDRPFLVVVRHRETGAIYFVARVIEP